jgi:hypothetical protein
MESILDKLNHDESNGKEHDHDDKKKSDQDSSDED